MAAMYEYSDVEEKDKLPCQDTFPEVAFFEVPSELNNGSKSASYKNRELVKHPAFRQVSSINGEINRMSVKSLRGELNKLDLNSRGTKDVLRKRLKGYERRRVLQEASLEDPNVARQHYTHLLVIDFEATCEEHQTKEYVHEIIEFPAVLLRVEDAAVIAEFHSLVRPVLNPTLTSFCMDLTGISQAAVDAAPLFPRVLELCESWLATQGVTEAAGTKLAVATDGPWDMARFLLMQCSVSKIPFPTWARSWINLRKVFSNFYVTKRLCLSEMLSALGLQFRGRPHCGLDDARNIAAIAEALLHDGCAPRVNETIAHLPRTAPPALRGSSVSSVTLKEFETSERRRNRTAERGARHTPAPPARDDGDRCCCDGDGAGGLSTICGAVNHIQITDGDADEKEKSGVFYYFKERTDAAASRLCSHSAGLSFSSGGITCHDTHDTSSSPVPESTVPTGRPVQDLLATVEAISGQNSSHSLLSSRLKTECNGSHERNNHGCLEVKYQNSTCTNAQRISNNSYSIDINDESGNKYYAQSIDTSDSPSCNFNGDDRRSSSPTFTWQLNDTKWLHSMPYVNINNTDEGSAACRPTAAKTPPNDKKHRRCDTASADASAQFTCSSNSSCSSSSSGGDLGRRCNSVSNNNSNEGCCRPSRRGACGGRNQQHLASNNGGKRATNTDLVSDYSKRKPKQAHTACTNRQEKTNNRRSNRHDGHTRTGTNRNGNSSGVRGGTTNCVKEGVTNATAGARTGASWTVDFTDTKEFPILGATRTSAR